MKCKVRNYHFELVLYDGNQMYYKAVDDGRNLHILLDEDIYIDPRSCFVDELKNLMESYIRAYLTENTEKEIENRINCLLLKYRDLGCIFKAKEIFYDPSDYLRIYADEHFNDYNKYDSRYKGKQQPSNRESFCCEYEDEYTEDDF